MNVDLEDVIKLLEEVLESKTKLALIPGENANKQYAMIGAVDGVRSSIAKLKSFYGRESY